MDYRVQILEGNRVLRLDEVTGQIFDEKGNSVYLCRDGKVYSRSESTPFCNVLADGRMVDKYGSQIGFIMSYPMFVRNQPTAGRQAPPAQDIFTGRKEQKQTAGNPVSQEKKPGGHKGRIFFAIVAVLLIIIYFNGKGKQIKIPVSKYYTPVQNTFARDALISDGARQVYNKIEKAAYTTPTGEDNLLYQSPSQNHVTPTDVFLGWKAYKEDHPEDIWTIFGVSLDGSRYAIYSDFSKAELEEKREKLFNALQAVLDSVPSGLSGEEREKYIHDYLLNHCEYDYDALNAAGEVDPNYRDVKAVGTAYGPLVNHKAVCAGYSQANQLLLNRLGVYCMPVYGNSGVIGSVRIGEANHEWNAVKSGSRWYMTDVTWDDTGSALDQYKYFHLSIADMKKDHTPAKLDQNHFVYNAFIRLNSRGDTIFMPME